MRTLEGKMLDGNVLYVKIAGLSTETKPTGLAMGSEFHEVDTGDTYIYNESSGEWVESSSGGGGGGSGDLTTATVTVVNEINRQIADVINVVTIGDYELLETQAEIIASTTTIVTAVLYKNHGGFYIDGFDANITASGSATYLGDGFVDITGDCTLTLVEP